MGSGLPARVFRVSQVTGASSSLLRAHLRALTSLDDGLQYCRSDIHRLDT